MKLGNVEQSLIRSDWRIVDNQSPDNNALVSSELLLSGDTVHYIQPVNNGVKMVLECYDSYAKYKAILALSRARELVFLDTGTELIPVRFGYEQNPCVKWKNSQNWNDTPDDWRDYFTVHLVCL